MSNRFKKIFLALSIAIPFLLYCTYYYYIMVKNAPYKFSEIENITLKQGIGSQYDKIYSSKSQEFQYLTSRDSVVKAKVKLSKDDMLFLHRKAAELGFWDWPEKMLGDTTLKSPRYYLEFDYQRKKKIIVIDASYDENIKLRDAALELAKTVDKAIQDADDVQN
jgi:hypothetical protein